MREKLFQVLAVRNSSDSISFTTRYSFIHDTMTKQHFLQGSFANSIVYESFKKLTKQRYKRWLPFFSLWCLLSTAQETIIKHEIDLD